MWLIYKYIYIRGAGKKIPEKTCPQSSKDSGIKHYVLYITFDWFWIKFTKMSESGVWQLFVTWSKHSSLTNSLSMFCLSLADVMWSVETEPEKRYKSGNDYRNMSHRGSWRDFSAALTFSRMNPWWTLGLLKDDFLYTRDHLYVPQSISQHDAIS